MRPMPITTASSIAPNTQRSSARTDVPDVEFGYYDTNGDGKLDRAEFVDKPNRAFVLLDKGNSCRLDASQVAGARAHTEQVFDSKKAESGDPRDHPVPGVK